LTETETEVSLVLRETLAVRLAAVSAMGCSIGIRGFLIRRIGKYPEVTREAYAFSRLARIKPAWLPFAIVESTLT